jgi:hypothetical protein
VEKLFFCAHFGGVVNCFALTQGALLSLGVGYFKKLVCYIIDLEAVEWVTLDLALYFNARSSL